MYLFSAISILVILPSIALIYGVWCRKPKWIVPWLIAGVKLFFQLPIFEKKIYESGFF